MIPHKIQLKNFLSYGPQLQTIDFSSHALICLSGKNGHGKSALLDAMTWALWGQARKVLGTAKADPGLLRLGQTQMLVIFDFEFGGKLYRIRREYMETYGKPLSVLEFGLVNPATQEFITLTDKTIRYTQAKIEQTLRLDFESFSNSAFLRQGNSNEFSKKSPKDRKQILAAILGLDRYEVIRKLALEKIKDATAKKHILMMMQEKRVQELTTQENLALELAILNEQTHIVINEEKQWKTDQLVLENARLSHEQEQTRANFLLLQIKQITENKQNLYSQLIEVRKQWRTVHTKKQSLHTVDQLEQSKKNVTAAITQQQKLFQYNLEKKEALLSISQQLNAIEQADKDERAHKNQELLLTIERLNGDQKNRHNIALMIEDELKKQTLEHTAITTHSATLTQQLLASAAQAPAHIEKTEAHLEKRKTTYQHFVSLGNWINAELHNLSNKKKLVHEDDPSCPLCEQNLSASRRRFLKANFDKNESFLSHRLQRLKRIIPALKEILVSQHAQLTADKELIKRAHELQTKITELTAAQETITTLSTAHTEKLLMLQQEINTQAQVIKAQQKNILPQLDSISTFLCNTNTHYQELTQQKMSIEKELLAHPYNKHEYDKQQELLTCLENQLADYESLKKEVAQQDNRKQEVHKLCIALRTAKKDERLLQEQLRDCGDLNAKALHLQEQEKQLKQTLLAIRNKQDTLLHSKGSIENQKKQLEKIKRDYEFEHKNISLFDSIIEDYQTISTATGKDGIQALLIEEAIPEIEQETNQLLSQLTNNQAQIFIESLRDLKKGGTKETLDIKISDQNGIRPYEMFSGGEAFRIDFALRIAISKLLARRAGTALQTLIIDEGFGSQDEEGLSHIMDALHTIRDNFSKIIVVSHLPAMKDQFPVQFFIHKGVQGSTVTVIEQG